MYNINKEHKKAKKYVEEKGYDVVLSGYVGSQHLRLADELSDYDFVFYILPKKEDIYTGKRVNREYQVTDTLGVKVISWLGVGKQLYKASFNLFEILVDVLYVDKRVKKEVEEMKERIRDKKAYKNKLEKEIYFMGRNKLQLSKRKPEKGSRVKHYEEGVDYKSLSKAWLYYRILSEGFDIWELYEYNSLPERIKEEYKRTRQGQKFKEWDLLEEFYGKDVMQEYISKGNVDKKEFKGDNEMLAEPLKYVFDW